MIRGYSIVVEPLSEEDGGGFVATVPDLPGCMADGDTHDAALADAHAAIDAWTEEARRLGRPVPAPGSSLGQWRQRVPRTLHRKLKLRAEAEGVSLNQLVTVALADYIARHD